MVQENELQHSQGASPVEDAANTRKDSWEVPEGQEAESKVFVQSSTESSLDKSEGMLPFIIASFFLSVIFPPIGCVAFCMSLNAPSGSSRAIWGERALGLGALLSFVYTLLLAMLLSEFYFIPKSAILGYGY